MTPVILIPWAQTDWHAAGRFATTTPVDINEHGQQQVSTWAPKIATHEPAVLYVTEDGPGHQTASKLSEQLKIKVKNADDLEEIALGLWEGMTPDQLKKRFQKAYKQWRDDPASVCPPEGEDISLGTDRVLSQIKKLAAKHKDQCFAVILGPLSFAAVRCMLEDNEFNAMWDVNTDEPVKYFLNLEEDKAILTT